MRRTLRIIVEGGLMLLSAAGWVIFTAFSAVLHQSLPQSNPDGVLTPSQLRQLMAPAWLAVASYPLAFTVRTMLIFLSRPNWRHCTHAILMLLSPILTMGAGLAIAVGVALQSKEVGQFIIVPSPMAVRTMVAGAASTLGLFWISLVVAPLLELKRTRYHDYQELLDTSINNARATDP